MRLGLDRPGYSQQLMILDVPGCVLPLNMLHVGTASSYSTSGAQFQQHVCFWVLPPIYASSECQTTASVLHNEQVRNQSSPEYAV